jgi:hypothetical protein
VSDNEQVQLKPGEWLDDTRDNIDLALLHSMLSKLATPKAFTLAEHDAATAYGARLKVQRVAHHLGSARSHRQSGEHIQGVSVESIEQVV